MPKRVPDKISLSWLLHNPRARDILQYGDQHKSAIVISPEGKVVPGRYTHTSRGVVYDLRAVETSAEPAVITPPVLTVTEDDANQELDVTWTLPEPYDELFLERSEDESTWTVIATLAGNAESYDDADVTPGTTYYYRIRARVGGAYSAYSNIDSGLLTSSDYAIFGTGANDQYQLGLGVTGNVSSFTVIDSSTDYIQVTAGEVDCHFLKSDGTIWAAGTNGVGNIGDGTTTTRQTPVQIGSDTDWIEIKGGRDFTLAKKSNGALWAWGANDGQLGVGDFVNKESPTQVGVATDWADAVIGCGYTHALVVKSDGTLWATGENWNGELGQGDFGFGTFRNVFTQIGTDTDWAFCAGGRRFSIAIKTDGTMWAFGGNSSGQFGDGSPTTRQTTPVQVGTDTDWAKVSCGKDFSIAIKTDGTMWATGQDITGETGQGSVGNSLDTWTQIGTDTDWESVDCGELHSLARKTNGTFWAWGVNAEGELGLGDTSTRDVPTQIGSDTDWGPFVASEFFSIAAKATAP